MKISVEFDLSNEEDRKHYNAWIKMKELTLNLEKMRGKLSTLNSELEDRLYTAQNNIDVQIFFDEMIWKKLL